ncbi:MAG: VOC family protein [Acidimicrobiia bacterium]
MTDPVALAVTVVEALDQRDAAALRALVPQRFWGWLDTYLQEPEGWQTIEELAGVPRLVAAARLLGPNMARLTLEGPHGKAFVTVTFDQDDKVKGFALDAEEFEGIATIVITCPDERAAELRTFYAALVGQELRRRPRLHFDEGTGYRPPRWPDPEHPQQMHLDIHVRDLNASHRLVLDRDATLLADSVSYRTYADPIGHPFCLYPGDADGLWRVVIDCPDATELEEFYSGLLGGDPVPELALQEVAPYIAPRWPDPAFPAQAHLDLRVDDRSKVQARIERLGAVRLPPQGGSCPVYADPAGQQLGLITEA